MNPRTRTLARFLSATLLGGLLSAGAASAHFPWLVTEDAGQVELFFGETPADRTYKLPASVAKSEVFFSVDNASIASVSVAAVDSPEFVGLRSEGSVPAGATVASKVTYGVYHGSRLDYFVQAHDGKLPASRAEERPFGEDQIFQAEIVDTDSGVDIFVVFDGQPVSDAEVKLFCSEGHVEGKAETDSDGKVSFSDSQLEDGLNAIVVGRTVESASGSLDGVEYSTLMQYLTATFIDPEDYEVEADVSVVSGKYPELPELVTSFGAAIQGEGLYVYGGHTGEAHSYYAEAQARTLRRLNLADPVAWEELGTGPGLQGLALVGHAGRLYRIGGFTAKNKQGEDKELWSQSAVACFDIESGVWQELPALPEPRSSFDAVVDDGKIYVIGGWNMQGADEATWLETAYVMDLAADSPKWQALPTPPFKRRALSVAAVDGKIYAVGGMRPEGGPTTRVDVYDTATGEWSQVARLNGAAMEGFGSSSFASGGRLYSTTYSGNLQRLASDGRSWEALQVLEKDRFFHRMLAHGDGKLITLGGSNMSTGKFAAVDEIVVAE